MNDMIFRKILSNTKTFSQTLFGRSQEIENKRRLPDDIVEGLRNIGIFNAMLDFNTL